MLNYYIRIYISIITCEVPKRCLNFDIQIFSVTLVKVRKFDSGIAGRSTSYPRENIEISKSRQKLGKIYIIISEYRILASRALNNQSLKAEEEKNLLKDYILRASGRFLQRSTRSFQIFGLSQNRFYTLILG